MPPNSGRTIPELKLRKGQQRICLKLLISLRGRKKNRPARTLNRAHGMLQDGTKLLLQGRTKAQLTNEPFLAL